MVQLLQRHPALRPPASRISRFSTFSTCVPTPLPQHQLVARRSVALVARRSVATLSTAGGAAAVPQPSGGGSSSSSGSPSSPSSPSSSSTPGSSSSDAAAPAPKSVWQRIKHFFIGEKLDKERLKALGLGAFASYSFVSNVNYGTALGMAWLAFVKLNGVAPTAPGQWPAFLGFYAGFWAVQNFVRPLRISLALALAPAFDSAITRLGERLGLPKSWAFGVFLIALGSLTTVTLFGSLFLLGGFPPTPAALVQA